MKMAASLRAHDGRSPQCCCEEMKTLGSLKKLNRMSTASVSPTAPRHHRALYFQAVVCQDGAFAKTARSCSEGKTD